MLCFDSGFPSSSLLCHHLDRADFLELLEWSCLLQVNRARRCIETEDLQKKKPATYWNVGSVLTSYVSSESGGMKSVQKIARNVRKVAAAKPFASPHCACPSTVNKCPTDGPMETNPVASRYDSEMEVIEVFPFK